MAKSVEPSGEIASKEYEPRRTTIWRGRSVDVLRTANLVTALGPGAPAYEASTRVLPSRDRPPVWPSFATYGTPYCPGRIHQRWTRPSWTRIASTVVPFR